MKLRSVVVGALIVVPLGVAGTAPALASPGPNGHNNHGLCEAIGSGSANGQLHKSMAPPFQALSAAAMAMNETVAQYCAAFGGEG